MGVRDTRRMGQIPGVHDGRSQVLPVRHAGPERDGCLHSHPRSENGPEPLGAKIYQPAVRETMNED